MQKSFLSIVIFLLLSSSSYGHSLPDTIPARNNLSKIKLMNGHTIKCHIVQATDSSIDVVSKKHWRMMLYDERETIHAANISSITKNFKNGLTPGKGALVGGAAGLVLALALSIDKNDCDPLTNPNCNTQPIKDVVQRAVLLGPVLGTGGAIIGLFSKKQDRVHYEVNGDREVIRKNKFGLTF